MWPTVDGYRILVHEEAQWMRQVANWMLGKLITESQGETEQEETGVSLFDQWDCRQRIWLLEQTVVPMLSPVNAPDAAAILEATIEAIFAQTTLLIDEELLDLKRKSDKSTWQSLALNLISARRSRSQIAVDENDIRSWRQAMFQTMTDLFGPASYWKAESHRDGEFQQTAKFLHARGLPSDFLARIPPLQTQHAMQTNIERLRLVLPTE